jgi:glutaredoxin
VVEAVGMVARFATGAGLIAVALGVALVARRAERRTAVRSPLNLAGVEGRVVLLSDAACPGCADLRRLLDAAGVPFTEVAYDTDPEFARSIGVVAVPLVVVRGPDGQEAGRIGGRVSPRRFRRLIEAAGL